MAFIFEAERKGNTLKSEVPGPGQYFAEPNSRTSNRGFAPFLSTVERNVAVINKKPTKQDLPGPGAYDAGLCISNSLKPNKTFHSTLVPEKEHSPQVQNSTVFKSKTKRFEHKIETDLPGPGKYYKDKGFIKAATATNLSTKSANTLDIRVFTKDQRLNVPSIPSYVHSYGYTEADNKKLALNQNPLIEIQQFVGPGYYDMKDQFTPDSNKGTTWYKSGGKRFESTALKHSVTKNVGPGSYDINMEGAEPMYKTKATSGFASTTNRNFLNMDKPRTSPRPTHKEKIQFEIGLAKPDTMVSDNNSREQYVDPDHGPGPGYYYNEMNSTTLKLSYKPTKLQFFGSGTERFKENYDNMLGPGDYNTEDQKGKKSKVKAAFLSNEKRLKDGGLDGLGPGQYDARTTLVDRVKEKAKRGYLGSFGSTELRFKEKKSEDEANERGPEFFKPPPVNHRPDPVPDEPKNSHVFQSKIEKFPQQVKFETPPPGAYQVNNFDIAKKILEGVNPLYTAKKAPFNNSETRFKHHDQSNPKLRRSPEDDQVDEHVERKRAISYKPGIKQVNSSAFASKTNRSLNNTAQNVPGPGSYQGGGAGPQDGWNKKTFNIKYLEERGK